MSYLPVQRKSSFAIFTLLLKEWKKYFFALFTPPRIFQSSLFSFSSFIAFVAHFWGHLRPSKRKWNYSTRLVRLSCQYPNLEKCLKLSWGSARWSAECLSLDSVNKICRLINSFLEQKRTENPIIGESISCFYATFIRIWLMKKASLKHKANKY